MKRLIGAIIGLVIGGLGGYAFYYIQYGSPGACPVPGSPWTNPYFLTFLGAFIGAIVAEGVFDTLRRRR